MHYLDTEFDEAHEWFGALDDQERELFVLAFHDYCNTYERKQGEPMHITLAKWLIFIHRDSKRKFH